MYGRDELDGADEGDLGGCWGIRRGLGGRGVVYPNDEWSFALVVWNVGFFMQDVATEGCTFRGEIATDAERQVDRVDRDLDKDVKRLERRLRDGN